MIVKQFLFLLLIIFQLGFYKGNCQNQTDSLNTIINKTASDTSRVLLLDQIAFKLMDSKPFVALQYANQGLALSRKIGFKKGSSRMLNRLGTIYRKTSNFGQSLKVHLEALDISESIGDLEGLCKIYNNLGLLYGEQRDYKKGIDFEEKAFRIANQLKNKDLIESALHNKALFFELSNSLDSANIYFNKIYKIQKSNNDKNYIYYTISNLGFINLKLKRYDLAISNFKKIIPYFKKVGNDRILGELYLGVAKVFYAQNQPDSSLFYAKKSLNLAETSQNFNYIYQSSIFISQFLENKNPRLSLDYFKRAVAAKDSLFSIDKTTQMQSIAVQDELKRQELLESKKNFDNRLKFSLLIGLLGAFLIITFIQYRNNKHKQKANRLLHSQKIAIENQKTQIETSLEKLKTTQNQLIEKEKLASLGELTAGIAHEIQNPLNFVNNFSELNIELINEIQAENSKNVEERDLSLEGELLADMASNQEKILYHGNRASNIVKAMLEHSRKSDGQRTLVDINLIADEFLRLSYLGLRSKFKDFNAEFELIEEENLPKIKAISQEIGQVLLNLFNNAFYSVNDKSILMHQLGKQYLPKVIVTTKALLSEELNDHIGVVEIRVIDNGNGIPEHIKNKIMQPFFTTKPTGEGTGLGLSLSYEIITKGHNGSISIESIEGEGATFIIKLPTQ